jgi:hypothetical protein
MVYKRRGRRGGQDGDEDGSTTTSVSPMLNSPDDDADQMTPPTMGGRRRRRRGGANGVASSATTYEMNTVGDGQAQWNNVFNNGATMHAPTGNGLWSADLTQNVSRFSNDPTLGSLLQGGRRRKKTRRGGNLMGVVGQAAVPFALLGMQHAYSKRRGKKGGRKSKRTRKSGGRKSMRHVKKVII